MSTPTSVTSLRPAAVVPSTSRLALSFRVPGWATGSTLTDGRKKRAVDTGVVTIERVFRKGDEFTFDLPMTPRFTYPAAQIDAIRGCLAVERGPEVLCLELPGVSTVSTVDAIRVHPMIAPREIDDQTGVTGQKIDLDHPTWRTPEPRTSQMPLRNTRTSP